MNQAVLSQKQAVVTEISDKMKSSQSTVVCEYRGLSVAEVTELRRNLREENVDFKVYKNSMFERACDECGFEELKNVLTGPNAFAFSEDATAPARVLAKFAKKHKALVLKSGIVEGKVVDEATIKELSSLPNRDGMLSMLLSCLQSPVSSFARVVKAVADAKESGAPVEAAAPAEETPAQEEAPQPEAAPAEETKPAEEAAA
ncbi:MAG: 50S ribosomal protein L10 [Erysipelotrichaceae bacterium]|nr:50S ribosomal protein L10 [Erysipelotrichaceae bacterium]